MITLFGTLPLFGLPQGSPFALKAEVLLKMSGLPYRNAVADMTKAPRGKQPWIEDAGEIIPDSRIIRHHLETRHAIDFTGGYTPREQAIGLMVERMLESHLYWFTVENRWCEDGNFAKIKAAFFAPVPAPIRTLIAWIVRRKVRRAVRVAGISSLPQDERRLLIGQVLAALNDLIDGNSYLLGESPCGADATAYAFLAVLASPHFDTPYAAQLRSFPALTAYIARMHGRYFGQSPDKSPSMLDIHPDPRDRER